MTKKLSVAFIWHMHQPAYKDINTGEYLMPWVRLHAVKDYLDMILLLDKYPEIRQTFNITPLLIDQIIDYGYNNVHDTYSRLSITDVRDLSKDDKLFILEHFFDANYENMIIPHESYKQLYDKRFNSDNIDVEIFTDQELSDVMAWFNLVWFDPYWLESMPALNLLYQKGKNFTIADRKSIIEMQREIIRGILPKYKDSILKGQIEVSTSPYYHPIMPLLMDSKSALIGSPDVRLPENNFKYIEDVKKQLVKSLDKFKDVFGDKEYGIWPSEHCISPETIDLMSKLGVKWTIADEGILSETIQKEFVRDFHGDLEYPYHLCKLYQVVKNDQKLNILFRNSVLSDLIGFEYGSLDSNVAANDLYERIKNIQDRLQNTPECHHIVTIALDGENCWESYKDDGKTFLNALYKLLSEDESLDITTVSQFIEKVEPPTSLDTIHSGSWINRDFQLWIGDPTKNLAWDYLYNTRQDLIKFIYEREYPELIVDRAWEEIYIAQGSDWFWWYGEPNDSGQDELFDKLFRMHLQQVYKILEKPVPSFLQIPLDIFVGKPLKAPESILTPDINGEINSDDEWTNAGCIEIPQGPMYQSDKLIHRIFYGNDNNNLYFRFDLNSAEILKTQNEIFIYLISKDNFENISPIRLRNKGNTIFQPQMYSYSYEIELQFSQGLIKPPVLSEAISYGLWKIKKAYGIKFAYKKILEIAIPFSEIGIKNGQEFSFVFATSKAQTILEIIPQNKLLSIRKPF